MRARRQETGFTLIELMITVAVVGILAAIALPTYNTAQRKSRRADAEAALMNMASRQQQMLIDTRSYAGTLADLHVSAPANVAAHYNLSIALGTDTVPTFVASATPYGDQLKDSCGALSIDQNGTKLPANCW